MKKLQNTNYDKTEERKNCEKAQKLKLWWNSKLKLWQNSKAWTSLLVRATWHLDHWWDVVLAAFAILRCLFLTHCWNKNLKQQCTFFELLDKPCVILGQWTVTIQQFETALSICLTDGNAQTNHMYTSLLKYTLSKNQTVRHTLNNQGTVITLQLLNGETYYVQLFYSSKFTLQQMTNWRYPV